MQRSDLPHRRSVEARGRDLILNIDTVCLYLKIEAHFTVTFPGCPRCATAASRDDIIPAVNAGNSFGIYGMKTVSHKLLVGADIDRIVSRRQHRAGAQNASEKRRKVQVNNATRLKQLTCGGLKFASYLQLCRISGVQVQLNE